MTKPAAKQNPRVLLTYIPRDASSVREKRLIGGWQGDFVEVDVQLELFSREETGANTPRTELVEIAVDGFGTGPAYRIEDLDPALWFITAPGKKRVAREDEDCPKPIAYLSDTGANPAYPREWRCDDSLAAEIIGESAVRVGRQGGRA